MLDIRKLFLESLETVLEDKTSMIKKLVLPDIEDNDEKEAYKQQLISFFKSHSNFENKIDWNKFKTLAKKDFDGLIASADQTKGAEKRREKSEINLDVKNIFKSQKGREFEVVGENDRWLFVAPLNYEAAKFCDSSENQGAGAKWCIGYEKTDEYWEDYIYNIKSLFTIAFNKNYKDLSQEELQTNLKYMIEKTKEGNYKVWNQEDENKGNKLSIVGQEKATANEMFEKVEKAFENYKERLAKNVDEKVEKILKNVDEINEETLKKYKKFITKIEIPDNITKIGDRAFFGCIELKSVVIPSSVTSIGFSAFYECRSLMSARIPDSVTSIGSFTFFYCTNLTSVVIPNSVTSIGKWAFSYCTSLTSIVIPDSVTSIRNFAFSDCKKLKTVYCSEEIWSKFREEFPEDAERKDIP